MRIRTLLPLMLLALGATAASGDDPQAPLNLTRARAMLLAEADQIAAGEAAMPRRETDLPPLRLEAHPTRLGQMLTRPIDRDPFRDAYVRWRLSRLPDAALPAMNDRAFARFLEQLPAVEPNPLAEPGLVDRALRAANEEQMLTPERVAELNERAAEVIAQQEAAFARRTAAIGLRQTLIRRLEKERAHGRALSMRIELAAAVVRGGWSAAPFKRDVQAAFEQAADRNDLSAGDLERVIAAAQRASGVRTPFIARFRASETGVEVDIGETAIDDFEVRDWLRPLRR